MTTRSMSFLLSGIVRPALLDGNSAGKMPVPTGRWVWPTAALALALATFWGARHIEQQVNTAAPAILVKAGVDSTRLEFNSTYRTVDVGGVLPENISSSHVETILTSYAGPNSESIRHAVVSAKTPVSVAPKATPDASPVTEDVRVTAVVNYDQITLTGNVPAQSDEALLMEAAEQSFHPDFITNKLTISDKPATLANTAQHLNELATVVSNLDSSVRDAHVDLDNDLLTGNITSTDIATASKIKTLLPDTLIGFITDNDSSSVTPIAPELESLVYDTELPLHDPVVTHPVPYETTEYTVVSPEPYTDTYTPAQPPVEEDQVSLLQSDLDKLATRIASTVVFASASDILPSQTSTVLDEIIAALHAYPDTSIEIGGHTDSQSSAKYNLSLSQRRADSVAAYLTDGGIESYRLSAIGYGETQPIADNATSDGRILNRRVEIRVRR